MTDDLTAAREKIVSQVKSFFSPDKEGDELTEQRKKMLHLFTTKKQWLIWTLLLGIVLFGWYIRVQNFPILHDVTDQSWVSIDLDSHIYLKYAKVIQEKGYLPDVDYSRFVPIGAPTANYAFPAYIIYYLYSAMHAVDPTVTIEYADIIYPVAAFALGVVFFFLFARRVFGISAALLSSFLLAIMPAFLQRTMGGSSDHDALGMMLMFLALYLFLRAWQAPDLKASLGWGIAAGAATGLTGLSWGAWKFLALIFGLFVLMQFLFEAVERRQVYAYLLWYIAAVVVMVGWVPLFPLQTLVTSLTTAFSLFVLLVLLIDIVVQRYHLEKKVKLHMPRPMFSLLLCLVISMVGAIVILGPSLLNHQLAEAKQLLLRPMGKDRWELTVAEQHQPYFKDVLGFFGPYILRIPVVYLLFLLGTIFTFSAMIKPVADKLKHMALFVAFLLALLLSRYSSEGNFNGTSTISLGLYFGSMAAFAIILMYYIFTAYRHQLDKYKNLKHWGAPYLLTLIWIIFMVIAARGAIRLIFIFAPVAALMAGYALVHLSKVAWDLKNAIAKYTILAVLLFLLISPLAAPWEGIIPSYADQSTKQATYSGPPYNAQWQIAGTWVKENIQKEAVFGHWWDYGYWVQNGFERASVLDGANKVKYWNFLMGRNVLTAHSQAEALPFLYAHNTSHYLIVSDEIGKYTAYSSIGSDENYDRYSWITTFVMNQQGTQERRNATVYFYQGGHGLDDDFVWEGQVFPAKGAGIGAVLLPIFQETKGNETVMQVMQPSVALVYQNKRLDVPLTCLQINDQFLLFEGPGYNGCFRVIPLLDGNGQLKSPIGAGLLVSEEGRKALWVNLYVFDQKNPEYDTSAFRSVYEDKYLSILAIVQDRLMGPIKIWEINYPKGFTITEEEKARYLGGNELLPDYFFKV